MDKKTLIILFSAIVIIVYLVFGFSNKDAENLSEEKNAETNIELNYNEVTDETTGEKYYQIYNKETGEVMHNVIDEASIQMYIDNPDFVGPENEEINKGSNSDYNEDESVKENIE